MQIYDSAAKRTPVISQLREIWASRGLLRLLVIRDLTVRYKRSVIGIWWSLLNPILTTTVLFYVFNTVFMRGLQNREAFLPYLFSGVLMMTLFNQSLNFAAESVSTGSGVLNKVYVRPEVFALSGPISSTINFIFGLVPLTVVLFLTHHSLSFNALLLPVFILAMALFTTGIGLLMAIAYLEFDDSRHLIAVLLLMLQYMTPVFYPINMLGDTTQRIIKLNPLTSYLDVFRNIYGNTYVATSADWLVVIVSSIIVFCGGLILFARWWPKGVTKL